MSAEEREAREAVAAWLRRNARWGEYAVTIDGVMGLATSDESVFTGSEGSAMAAGDVMHYLLCQYRANFDGAVNAASRALPMVPRRIIEAVTHTHFDDLMAHRNGR